MIYKKEDPISSLSELLEQFARQIADLQSRVAELEKRNTAKQE